MRKIIFAAVLAFSLTACAAQSDKPAPTPLATAYAAEAGFVSALALAAQYTDLPRCGQPAAPPLCSDPSAVAEIRKAAKSGRAIIEAAIATITTPGVTTDVAKAAAAGAVNAAAALRQVLATYNVK
jgi:hypothetical protein